MLQQRTGAWRNVRAKKPDEVLRILELKVQGITAFYTKKRMCIQAVFWLWLVRSLYTVGLNMYTGSPAVPLALQLCFVSALLWAICVLMTNGRWGYCCVLLLLAAPCYEQSVPYCVTLVRLGRALGWAGVWQQLLVFWWEPLYILLNGAMLVFLVGAAVYYLGVPKNRVYANTYFYAAARQHLDSAYSPDGASSM